MRSLQPDTGQSDSATTRGHTHLTIEAALGARRREILVRGLATGPPSCPSTTGSVWESARNALFRNEWPDPIALLVYFVLAAFVMWLGWAWFEKTKKGFADVL